MRNAPNVKAERCRVSGPPRSNNGAFLVEVGAAQLGVVVSDGYGWDHVSVSTRDRCPTWEEMCLIKWLFFRADECVMQLHPPEAEWINAHPFCLHLWRPQTAVEVEALRREYARAGATYPDEDLLIANPIPRPPGWMVGPAAGGEVP